MHQVLSQSAIQKIAKLKQKKYRDLDKTYLVSGYKAVKGALEADQLQPKAFIYTQHYEQEIQNFQLPKGLPLYQVTTKDFNRLSDEKSPQGVALLLERPSLSLKQFQKDSSLSLYLEEVNDPGNLGTIIRTALWFGVENILLSPKSADPFQHKVVRASAGYITQARIYEQIRAADLQQLKQDHDLSIAGTVLDSLDTPESLKPNLPDSILIAFGSEARGLSREILDLCNYKFTIPKKGKGESLNLGVAVALSIAGLCSSDIKSRD